MTGKYQLVYYDAENVGIIGILAYPKRLQISKLFMLWLIVIKISSLKLF